MPDSTHLVDKAVRLFTFLAKAQGQRQPPVRDFGSYTQDGAVQWFADLPDLPGIDWKHVEDSFEERSLLSIERIARSDPPGLPDILKFWLEGDIFLPDKRPELLLRGGSPDHSVEHLDSHLEVKDAFTTWILQWDAWAENVLRFEPARQTYADLFKVYVQATQKSEDFELVLGVGLLTWAPKEQERVRRHLFTAPAIPRLDDATGRLEFHLDESVSGLQVELDMLDPSVIPDQALVRNIEQQASSFDGDPMDPSVVASLGRTVAVRLHDQGHWDDDFLVPDVRPHPIVAWAPALVLRRRSHAGLVGALSDIAHQIQERNEVPAGLLSLVDPDRQPSVTKNFAPGAMVKLEDEVISPLPLNDVQRRILERVDSHAQTLVQGPPGTGKTHTAAALLSHLLAQGQRVLVTAHTGRALHEVRNKLPEQIRPLAVSVIGASRDELADLRTAVDKIARRAADHDVDESAKQTTALMDRFSRLGSERRRLGHLLINAREADVTRHEHDGYSGTLAEIAQRYQQESTEFSWLSRLATFEPNSTAPMSNAEALEWLGLLRDHTLDDDAEQSRRRRLPSSTIPDAATFAHLVEQETACRENLETFADVEDVPTALDAMPEHERAALRERLHYISRLVRDLTHTTHSWMPEALADVCSGTGEVWRGRAFDLHGGINNVDGLLRWIPMGAHVELNGDADRHRAMAVSLKGFLQGGGTLRASADGMVKIGVFSPSVVKECRPLLEEVRVGGLPPSTLQSLDAVMAHRDAWTQLQHLDNLWPSTVEIPQEDTARERVEWHRAQLNQLGRVLELGDRIRAEHLVLRHFGVIPPRWTDAAAVEETSRILDAASAKDYLDQTRGPLREVETHLQEMTRWADAADAVRMLHAAVQNRDHVSYAEALHWLVRLEQVSLQLYRRQTLTDCVSNTTPELKLEAGSSPDDPNWDPRLSRLQEAYRWGSIGAWVLAQDHTDTNTVQAHLAVIDQSLTETVEGIASQRAWDHAVSVDRLTPGHRADLRNYSQQVTRLGKGKGKFAAEQRAGIRRAMEKCRPAVPVWIMPIYRVAEQLPMTENMFDVVVIDEASQAGLEATFLQYLAPKIVVIGDDKQVSPAAVGVKQQPLRDLAQQYLYDDRYKDTWLDPQRSLFDEAQMRYGGQLTLTEHRRCVPEIIGFSNLIAYEPHGIRLVPVRQFGADRLEPFFVRHVMDDAHQGNGSNVNRAEARALVDDLKACLKDPAYSTASMAVISLVGDQQAKYIESLLMTEVQPHEWKRRELRVGTAPEFQGSERSVVFLSMVSSVQEGRRMGSLTREMNVQRFNVAVSRARDQVRLFHSVTLEDLPNKDDLRHQLLTYAYGVVRRGRDLEPGSLPQVAEDERVEPFDSLFEQRVHNWIVDRGFTVVPQVEALGYRLDLVVVGASGRLAVECDGDTWHGPDAYERDLARQRELERCGWKFFRVRESAFYVDKAAALAPLWARLEELGIRPSDWLDESVAEDSDGNPDTREDLSDEENDFGELAVDSSAGSAELLDSPETAPTDDRGDALEDFTSSTGTTEDSSVGPAPYRGYGSQTAPVSDATDAEILKGLLDIVAVEGPVLGNRLRTAYVVASGGHRVGKSIGRQLNSAMAKAERRGLLLSENPLNGAGMQYRTYRLPEQPRIMLRDLGPRSLDEVPQAELREAMSQVSTNHPDAEQDQLLRLTLRLFGRTSLTQSARETLEPIREWLQATPSSRN